MRLRHTLEQLGVGVESTSSPKADVAADVVLDVVLDGNRATLVVEVKSRAPYPNEVSALSAQLQSLEALGTPVLIAPYVSEPTGEVLSEAGWSWADAAGNTDIRAAGIRIQRRISTRPPRPPRTSLPKGTGSWAIIRALVADGHIDGASGAAQRAGISQPRASQVLGQLAEAGLVERETRTRWHADRGGLLDAFLMEYDGPGGETSWFYTLDPVNQATEAVVSAAEEGLVAVSGDVAADQLAPWRAPTRTTIYHTGELRLGPLGIVPARGPDDGNVEIIAPADTSMFGPRDNGQLPLAHPTQVIWDLQRHGGSDRSEAADEVRSWLLSR